MRFYKIWYFLLVFVCFSFLATASPAQAAKKYKHYPHNLALSRGGDFGLVYLGSAALPKAKTFSFFVSTEYWRMPNFFNDNELRQSIYNSVAFSIVPFDFWEIFINGHGTSYLIDDKLLDDRTLVQSLGDVELGTKFSFRSAEIFWLGLDVRALFRTRRDGIGPDFGAMGVLGRLLLTLDLTAREKPIPLRFHINGGFQLDRSYRLIDDGVTVEPTSAHALGIPYDDTALVAGASIEVPYKIIDVFVEYSTEQYMDINNNRPTGLAKRTYITNPQRLTPGIRIFPLDSLHIDFSADLGISLMSKNARYDLTGSGNETKIMPDWVARVGLGYIFNPARRGNANGRVEGRVYNASTSEPVQGARISFPGKDLNALVVDGKGEYRSYAFESGPIKVRVDADQYQSVEADVVIINGRNVIQDFRLNYVAVAGELLGQVTDPQGVPLPATLYFDQQDFENISVDPKTGQFQIKIAPGIYTLRAEAKGYQPLSKRVKVVDKKRTVVNYILQPQMVGGTLKGTVKDTSGKPVVAVVNFGRQDISPVNVDQTTGAYETTLVPGNYLVKALAPGYKTIEKGVLVEKDRITVLDFVLEEMQQVGKVIGQVVDAKTGNGIYGVISFPGGENANIPTDPETGGFVIDLEKGIYQIKAGNPGYKSQTLLVKVEKDQQTKVKFELQPYDKVVVTKEKVEIKEMIQFETAKATIKVVSYPILDEIAQVLKENANMQIMIEGHTDNVGSDAYNKTLSQRRAGSVRDYLISRGVKASRLEFIGYGEERPIAGNDTDAGRTKNRRVEFKITAQ